MSSKSIKHINLVQDTKVNLESITNVLPKGLIFHETDTNKLKLSDGNSAYTNLPYTGGGELGDHASTETTYGASTVDKYGHSRHYSGEYINLHQVSIPYLSNNNIYIDNNYTYVQKLGDIFTIIDPNSVTSEYGTDAGGNSTTHKKYKIHYSTDLESWKSVDIYTGFDNYSTPIFIPITVSNNKYYVYRSFPLNEEKQYVICGFENNEYKKYGSISLDTILEAVKTSFSSLSYIDFETEGYATLSQNDIISGEPDSNQFGVQVELRYKYKNDDGTYGRYWEYLYTMFVVDIADISDTSIDYTLYTDLVTYTELGNISRYGSYSFRRINSIRYDSELDKIWLLVSYNDSDTYGYLYQPTERLSMKSSYTYYEGSRGLNVTYYTLTGNTTLVTEFSAWISGYDINELFKLYKTDTDSGLLLYGNIDSINYLDSTDASTTETLDGSSCIIKVPFATSGSRVFDSSRIQKWSTTTSSYGERSHVSSANIINDLILFSTIHSDNSAWTHSLGVIDVNSDIVKYESSALSTGLFFDIYLVNSEIYFIGSNKYANITWNDDNVVNPNLINILYKYNTNYHSDNETDVITKSILDTFKYENKSIIDNKEISFNANIDKLQSAIDTKAIINHQSSDTTYGESTILKYGHTYLTNDLEYVKILAEESSLYSETYPDNNNVFTSCVRNSSNNGYQYVTIFENWGYAYTNTVYDTNVLYGPSKKYQIPLILSGNIYSAQNSPNHIFVDSNGNVIISTSANGNTWNSTIIDFTFDKLYYLNNQYIGVESEYSSDEGGYTLRFAISNDGLTWDIITSTILSGESFFDLTYSDGVFIIGDTKYNFYKTTNFTSFTKLYLNSGSFQSTNGVTSSFVVANDRAYLFEDYNYFKVYEFKSDYIRIVYSSNEWSAFSGYDQRSKIGYFINGYFYFFSLRDIGDTYGDNSILKFSSDFSEHVVYKSKNQIGNTNINISRDNQIRFLSVHASEFIDSLNYYYKRLTATLKVVNAADELEDSSVTPSYVKKYVNSKINNNLNNNLITVDSASINVNSSTIFKKTITEDTTFTIDTPSTEYKEFTLFLVNAGAYTVSFPDTVSFSNGFEPIFTSSGIDILKFLTIDGGESWYCKQDGQHVH